MTKMWRNLFLYIVFTMFFWTVCFNKTQAAEQIEYKTKLTKVTIQGVTYEYVPLVYDPEDEEDDGFGNYYRVAKFEQEYQGGKPIYTDIVIQGIIEGIGVEVVGPSAFANHPEIASVTFLPDTIGLSGVIYIKQFAFLGCTGLKKIEFDGSVSEIGAHAFQGCNNLTEIEFSQITDWVGEYAFEGCSSLTSIAFVDTIWEIGECAFANCTSLTTIAFKKGAHKTIVGKDAFINTAVVNAAHKKGNATILENGVLLEGQAVKGNVNLSNDDVKVIMPYAFAGNQNIKKITLDGVKRIGANAFTETSITNVRINNAKSIARCAFTRCKRLRKASISGVRHISYGMFAECKKLKKVILTGTRSINTDVFEGCKRLRVLSIRSEEKLIWARCGTDGKKILEDCKKLKKINLKTRGVSKSIKRAGISKNVKLNVPSKKKNAYSKYVKCKVI